MTILLGNPHGVAAFVRRAQLRLSPFNGNPQMLHSRIGSPQHEILLPMSMRRQRMISLVGCPTAAIGIDRTENSS
ncbi:hypothetical protein [Sphingopyxis sp.]|uniref:hypothetical protein n=1 Tax=Sphingopyxis sp. TaxID=1908224 RepID=UPI0010F57518|nr:hypothetical protein [Sphingopyxis sp.]MBR2172331.1 hypothetical protein [Sphingopyxis sp.]